MSKPPKIDRKILKTPDEFVQKGTQILGSLSRSRLGLMPVLALVGLLLIGFYAYDRWDESREQKAWTDYYEATKGSPEQKWEKLKAVHQKWPSSRAGMLCSVEVADHHFENSKKEVGKESKKVSEESLLAVEWYTKALNSRHLQAIEKQLLLVNRGNAWELQEKWDDSLADYQLAESTSGPAKGLAQLSAARVNEMKGSTEKAIELYEKTSTDFAANEYGKLAKNHVRRLKSPLLNSKKGK